MLQRKTFLLLYWFRLFLLLKTYCFCVVLLLGLFDSVEKTYCYSLFLGLFDSVKKTYCYCVLLLISGQFLVRYSEKTRKTLKNLFTVS